MRMKGNKTVYTSLHMVRDNASHSETVDTVQIGRIIFIFKFLKFLKYLRPRGNFCNIYVHYFIKNISDKMLNLVDISLDYDQTSSVFKRLCRMFGM